MSVLDLHEADGDGQQPLVLGAPVERVLGVVGTVPGMDFDILVRGHLFTEISIDQSSKPVILLVILFCPWGN